MYARDKRVAAEQAQASAAVAALEESMVVRTPAEEQRFQAQQAACRKWCDAQDEMLASGNGPGGDSDDSDGSVVVPHWVLESMR